jgi:hypothetical protein
MIGSRLARVRNHPKFMDHYTVPSPRRERGHSYLVSMVYDFEPLPLRAQSKLELRNSHFRPGFKIGSQPAMSPRQQPREAPP